MFNNKTKILLKTLKSSEEQKEKNVFIIYSHRTVELNVEAKYYVHLNSRKGGLNDCFLILLWSEFSFIAF